MSKPESDLQNGKQNKNAPAQHFWWRLLRAWIAAVLLSVIGYAALVWAGLAYPPITLFGVLTQALGVPAVFQFLHKLLGLGQDAKLLAFSGVAVLWLGGLSLLGAVSVPWAAAGMLALLCIVGLGSLGWWLPLLYGLVFWALLEGVNRLLTFGPGGLRPQGVTTPTDTTRRLTTLGLAAGGAVVAGGGLSALLKQGSADTTAAAPVPGEPLPFGVTPVEQFYYVSKNLEAFDPRLSAEKWSLTVSGLVQRPKTYRLADLKQFAPVTSERTLSCISNPVGGPLISNGIWGGFRLTDLLRDVGIQKEARFVLWKAADGYTESLPLGEALDPENLLITQLNGEALNAKHGFPLRVLIPGRYGMKQPRWITNITLSAEDQPGYWVKRDWSKAARVELMSRIDQPPEIDPVVKAGRQTFIRGVAFFSQPITKVEVSTDGEKTWREAELVRPRSIYAWTPWQLAWTPEAGQYTLTVRAYSGDTVQKKADKDALPEGATGYHRFEVKVS
ncbi:molybdopterin-dependent oxidoreductase [Deinococcus detaillensis]|uniref:Molybdopterin-dependent oxidoreductase n=1 Tax=Deinococcus detaillensis TaxID=2592048 RepID=A0A553USD0_9DEIO|nr:molybdopterin-dependent oxidoreductase [Deinococcus detaillensis]TSA83120.1 molybdopterin-dependent oxidoreductase [Deinococcus detaillensis]